MHLLSHKECNPYFGKQYNWIVVIKVLNFDWISYLFFNKKLFFLYNDIIKIWILIFGSVEYVTYLNLIIKLFFLVWNDVECQHFFFTTICGINNETMAFWLLEYIIVNSFYG